MQLAGGIPADDALAEALRLVDDGLVDADVRRSSFGDVCSFRVRGLTDEGRSFWRLVENDDVWQIILGTLTRAGIDVSYPLLKEVCEEIVKRYVTSFIPDM